MTIIRLATIDDLPQYTQLMIKTYQQAYISEELGITADYFSDEMFKNEDTQNYFKSHLVNTDKQKTWLALKNGEVIGALTIIINNEDEAELTGFYVKPDSQKQGIGKSLYQLGSKFAGDRSILLDSYVHNKTIDVYKKWGFETDRTRGKDGYFTRHWKEWGEKPALDCVYLRLKRSHLN